MAQKGTEATMSDVRGKLSTLWTVVLFNMIYADIIGFLNPEFLRGLMTGYAEGVRITQQLLVASAVMVEVPILMVLLSRTLKPKVNRWANFAAIALTATFIIGGGSTSPHYLFLAAMELVCLALILRLAWRWHEETSPTHDPVNPSTLRDPSTS
jgi:Sec-independent protein secretion pathway component TatC